MNSLERFLKTYQQLDKHNLDLLDAIYSADIVFTDPAHSISGLTELKSYFAALYQSAIAVEFAFAHVVETQKEACIQWDMTVKHPRLKGGTPITVAGASFIRFGENGMVNLHRDYFDLGAMLYEHLPLLGKIITTIKRRLGQ